MAKKQRREQIELSYWRCSYCAAATRRFVKKNNILYDIDIESVDRKELEELVKYCVKQVGWADQFTLEE